MEGTLFSDGKSEEDLKQIDGISDDLDEIMRGIYENKIKRKRIERTESV